MTEPSSQEIWESTTGGTVWLQVKDPRVSGGWTQKKVGGKGTQRITLTVEEREFNQELIPFENEGLDPFKNGMLVRVSPKEVERGQYELTDEQLAEMLAIGNDDVFETELTSITSEVILRRLEAQAKKTATLARYEMVKGVIEDRYHIGKTQKVVQEIYNDDAKYADADI